MLTRIKTLHQAVLNQISSESFRFDQYNIIEKIQSYLELSSSPLDNEEKRGLCNGLSAYYLYEKSNNKEKQFFDRMRIIANTKNVSEIDYATEMEFDKAINYIRWLHNPRKLVSHIHQPELEKSIHIILNENEKPFLPKFGIATFFTEKEFVALLRNHQGSERMILLGNGGHAMSIYEKNGNYFFFDPDFSGGCEIKFSSAEDLYAWLIFQRYNYKENAIVNSTLSESIPLSIDIFHPFSNTEEKNSYPEPLDMMESQIKNRKFLLGSQSGMNVLFLNCVNYHPDIVKRLLAEKEIKQLINNAVNDTITPLVYCCQEGYSDLVELLLLSGADPDLEAPNTWTPLHKAVDSNSANIVRLLINAKADIIKYGPADCPLIFRAAEKGSLDVFKIVYEAYENKKIQADISPLGRSLLDEAVSSLNFDVVKFLLEKKLDPISINNKFEVLKAFDIALEKGNLSIIKLFLSFGAALPANFLNKIAISGKLDTIKFFIDQFNDEKKEEIKFTENIKITQDMLNNALVSAICANKLNIALYLIDNHNAKCTDVCSLLNILRHKMTTLSFNVIEKCLSPEMNVSQYEYTYPDYYNSSLAVWALKNKNNVTDETKNCIQQILNIIENNSSLNFFAQANFKAAGLMEKLHLETLYMDNGKGFFASYNRSKYEKAHEKIFAIDMFLTELNKNIYKPVKEILIKVEKKYPNFLSGTIMHRERDLINGIEIEQNKILFNLEKNRRLVQ